MRCDELSFRQTAIRMRLAGERVERICQTLHKSEAWFYKWWRRYLDFRPAYMIPAIATACILIIAGGIIGYLDSNDPNEFQPVAVQQNEELILSDKDLEIVKNLEFLKEMDAIQKLSQVVDPDGEINSQGELENETRGMRQDAYRKYFV